jgi:hypothetical protein
LLLNEFLVAVVGQNLSKNPFFGDKPSTIHKLLDALVNMLTDAGLEVDFRIKGASRRVA